MNNKIGIFLGLSTKIGKEVFVIGAKEQLVRWRYDYIDKLPDDITFEYGQAGKFLSDCLTAFGDKLSINRICRKVDSFAWAMRNGDLRYGIDIVKDYKAAYEKTDNWIERYIYLSMSASVKYRTICISLDDLDAINAYRYGLLAAVKNAYTYKDGDFVIADGREGIRGLINFALDMTRR